MVATAVTVRDGDRELLPPTDITLTPGRLTLVLSLTGVGEGVLVPALLGERALTGGSVLVDGRPVQRSGIAVVPRDHGLPMSLTAYETIVVALLGRSVSGADAASRATAALDAVGLGESGAHLIEELSGGQQQRVAVARALAIDAPILLADEPTSALDAANVVRVMTLLRAKAHAGSAVLVTSNDEAAGEFADDVIRL